MRGPLSPSGSSPHTRGGQEVSSQGLHLGGLIPAYAGRTRPDPCAGRSTGSSPHTRGGRVRLPLPLHPQRLIPAYAGRTPSRAQKARSAPAHPRIRGADRECIAIVAWEKGSSPHTRGGHERVPVQVEGGGLIPAYAGRTKQIAPRNLPEGGSSPHTRGGHFLTCRNTVGRAISHTTSVWIGRRRMTEKVPSIRSCLRPHP